VNVFDIIAIVVQAYIVVLFVRAILSWFPVQQGTGLATVVRALETVTEPVLRPVRRLIPPIRAGSTGIDISFLAVFIGLEIVVFILHRL
jgi:YggT family protein